MRVLYSEIRYLAINDHEGFKTFFNEFKLSNGDPFWWKTIILSSGTFMKNELKKEIKLRFYGDERVFLEHYIKTMTGLVLSDLLRIIKLSTDYQSRFIIV